MEKDESEKVGKISDQTLTSVKELVLFFYATTDLVTCEMIAIEFFVH